MNFNVRDKIYPQRGYMFDGKYIAFTGYHADVPADIAYRMSRISDEKEFEIEKKIIPFNTDSWKKDHRLIWSSNYASASGFGAVSENVVLELMKLGVKVQNPGSISGDIIHGGEFVDKAVLETVGKIIEPDCLEIQYCQPPSIRLNIVERTWAYVMYETTITPKSWIEKLNQLERVLVPTKWLVQSWQEQGLKAPISVFGHGVNPKVYSYLDRPDRDAYTFLHFGQLGRRKGTDIVVRAFFDEFSKNDNVRLILKGNAPVIDGMPKERLGAIMQESNLPYEQFGETRVKWIHSALSKERMRQLFFDSDCFVFPTRGEGFGLTPLEAMATGLPTIITGWSGVLDYSDPSDTLITNYDMVRSYEFDIIYGGYYDKAKGENSGYWAEAKIEEVRKYMRWCYEHRAEAKAMGKKAADRIAREWTWEKKTKELYNLIETHI